MTGAIESLASTPSETTVRRSAPPAARHEHVGWPGAWIDDVLRDGDLLVAAQGVGEPTTLIRELLGADQLPAEVELFVGLSHSDALAGSEPVPLPLLSFGAMGPLGARAATGELNIIPCHFADVARLLQVRAPRRVVPLVQVSPPDAHGYHSLGLSVDYTYELLQVARAVVAEVNDQVPVTSAPRIHASAFAATVRTSRPPPQISSASAGETQERIAEYTAALVMDGATIQLGVGALPTVVGRALAGHTGMCVHSTLVGDWLLDLSRGGALNEGPDAVLVSEVAGSQDLYRYVVSQSITIRPVRDLMDSATLGSINRFVSMNSALEVDLSGQVNAEQVSSGYVGGIGGQPDLLRAAQRSPGGRSIVMLPSTALGGRQSRIVRTLTGNGVTTLRSGVDFIVTEHGVADLRGKSLAERTEALIGIAAPEHRAGLRAL
ncbi:MAG TPA: acetyl-CoA hydrolase/transferase C-terminal domain-containing protein [Jatrophihabitans sp.]